MPILPLRTQQTKRGKSPVFRATADASSWVQNPVGQLVRGAGLLRRAGRPLQLRQRREHCPRQRPLPIVEGALL